MQRTFVYDGREFPDPDPTLSVEDVRKQLSEFFPELTNADTREEQRGDGAVIYTFSKRIGTKGVATRRGHRASSRLPRSRHSAGAAGIAGILRSVPEKRLRVFELAGELLASDGELDLQAAAGREPEVNLAVAEAKGYARATERALEALRRLAAR